MLFSATTTQKTEDLVTVALKKEPLYVGLEDRSTGGAATVQVKSFANLLIPDGLHLIDLTSFVSGSRAGLRDLPIREAPDAPLHLPQEEQEEEGHGLLLLSHERQIPP